MKKILFIIPLLLSLAVSGQQMTPLNLGEEENKEFLAWCYTTYDTVVVCSSRGVLKESYEHFVILNGICLDCEEYRKAIHENIDAPIQIAIKCPTYVVFKQPTITNQMIWYNNYWIPLITPRYQFSIKK